MKVRRKYSRTRVRASARAGADTSSPTPQMMGCARGNGFTSVVPSAEPSATPSSPDTIVIAPKISDTLRAKYRYGQHMRLYAIDGITSAILTMLRHII